MDKLPEDPRALFPWFEMRYVSGYARLSGEHRALHREVLVFSSTMAKISPCVKHSSFVARHSSAAVDGPLFALLNLAGFSGELRRCLLPGELLELSIADRSSKS
jgi:hypothetical protein